MPTAICENIKIMVSKCQFGSQAMFCRQLESVEGACEPTTIPHPPNNLKTPTCLFNTAVSWKERTLLRTVTFITSIALAGKSYTHKITGQTENAGTSYA